MGRTKTVIKFNSVVAITKGNHPIRYMNRSTRVAKVGGSKVYLDFFPRRETLLEVPKSHVTLLT